MKIPRVRGLVSREAIKREIKKAQKKLAALEKRATPEQRDAILRQKLELHLCQEIIEDIYIIGP
jgi:hypothetical protein